MRMQDGETPLMAAVQKGHLEAARVLLVECNCNANAKSLVGYSVYLTVHSTPRAQHISIICVYHTTHYTCTVILSLLCVHVAIITNVYKYIIMYMYVVDYLKFDAKIRMFKFYLWPSTLSSLDSLE